MCSSDLKGDWKLIYYHLDQRFELFNLESDIGETKNLSKNNPNKLVELANDLTNYLISVDAQMPSYKNTVQKVPFPSKSL